MWVNRMKLCDLTLEEAWLYMPKPLKVLIRMFVSVIIFALIVFIAII